jgi:hypothetical protein
VSLTTNIPAPDDEPDDPVLAVLALGVAPKDCLTMARLRTRGKKDVNGR